MRFTVGGLDVTDFESFRIDPLLNKWEINFRLPADLARGASEVAAYVGGRLLARWPVEIA